MYLCKRITSDESDDVFLSLNIINLTHSHTMASNPLQYKQHEKMLKKYVKTARIVAYYKKSFLSYSVNQRILKKEGLSLSRSDYYNLHYNKTVKNVQDEFKALVHALEEAGFQFTCRMEIKKNEKDETVSR
jgi:hypothetical protein